MGRKQNELSNEMRKLIINLHSNGKKMSEIARIVERSHSTVRSVVQIFLRTGRVEKIQRKGQKPKLTRRHKSHILREIRKNPQKSAVNLAADLKKNFAVIVTPQTVRNYIRKLGFNSRVAARKPFISKLNKSRRVAFAKAYKNYPINFWKRVIWTDECKFNLKMSDGRVKIWREVNTSLSSRNMLPTFKHGGGSVMAWGCFSAAGVGNLHFIDGIMDAKKYIAILKENLHEIARKLGLNDRFIFQQDNDPKHTARISQEWILYNCPKYLKTPPQSPDLNPIENLWSIFKKKIKYYNIRNV